MKATVVIKIYYDEAQSSSEEVVERALYGSVMHLANQGLLSDEHSLVDDWSCTVDVTKNKFLMDNRRLIDLPHHSLLGEKPQDPRVAEVGSVWWERCGDWEYPWLIVEHTENGARGYPHGCPRHSCVETVLLEPKF